MTISDIVSYAESLQRSCIYLTEAESGEPIAGYWGGLRSDVPGSFPAVVTQFTSRRHILSIDFDLLGKIGLKCRYPFTLTAWTSVDGNEKARAENLRSGALTDASFEDAIPLAAREAMSFPPLEAVCLYGDKRVEEWLKQEGLERWQYERVDRQIQSEFQNTYQRHCPHYSNSSIVAQLGGWHMMWSTDDFYIPREMNLLCWTFRDAEPWYEVFLSATGNLVIKERIT